MAGRAEYKYLALSSPPQYIPIKTVKYTGGARAHDKEKPQIQLEGTTAAAGRQEPLSPPGPEPPPESWGLCFRKAFGGQVSLGREAVMRERLG